MGSRSSNDLYQEDFVHTPGRRQSKRPTLSRNVDQKSIEIVFFYCDLSIFNPRSSIVDYVFDCRLSGVVRGGSICNENPFITPSTDSLGFYAICQTKDQSVAVIMVQETLFYLSKLFKLQTFLKAH